MTKQHDEAAARFETRWKQAMEQPELIEAPPVKLPLDLSPVAVLARLREIDPDVLGRIAKRCSARSARSAVVFFECCPSCTRSNPTTQRLTYIGRP